MLTKISLLIAIGSSQCKTYERSFKTISRFLNGENFYDAAPNAKIRPRKLLRVKTNSMQVSTLESNKTFYYKNYNFLDCDWFKKLLFSTNSLAKLLSDSLLLDSSISQSHSKL